MKKTEELENQIIDTERYENYLAQRALMKQVFEASHEAYLEKKVTQEESKPQVATAPRGKFYTDKYLVPETDREGYIHTLHEESVASRYYYFEELDPSLFYHENYNDSINWYFMDFKRTLMIFQNYYGSKPLRVLNGFRSPGQIGVKPHSVGIAIDLAAETTSMSVRIMNAAYSAGIPTIIPGGDIKKGTGYVHLDLAPKASFIYDAGIYEGPWSI